jgi:hypothetical protein
MGEQGSVGEEEERRVSDGVAERTGGRTTSAVEAASSTRLRGEADKRRERRSNPVHRVGGRYPAPWILLTGGSPEPDRRAREQGRKRSKRRKGGGSESSPRGRGRDLRPPPRGASISGGVGEAGRISNGRDPCSNRRRSGGKVAGAPRAPPPISPARCSALRLFLPRFLPRGYGSLLNISKDLALDRGAWRLAINVPEP